MTMKKKFYHSLGKWLHTLNKWNWHARTDSEFPATTKDIPSQHAYRSALLCLESEASTTYSSLLQMELVYQWQKCYFRDKRPISHYKLTPLHCEVVSRILLKV